MTEASIHVADLARFFHVPEREAGLRAAVGSLIRRRTRKIDAVDKVSFDIKPGEVVAFLGPNGAGKTTTLKMLSGLLHPSAGTVEVLGFVPSRRERRFLSQISLLMGNRSQLQWDIPAADSFDLIRVIYRIPIKEFERTRDELVDLLDLERLLRKPIRTLSLGERMGMELVGGLLHRPRVLFLDEPTIGLDQAMQKRVRQFIADFNRKTGATVLLTSHYMADVEALCSRVILIHHGRIVFDAPLSELLGRFASDKILGVTLAETSVDLSLYGKVIEQKGAKVVLRVPKEEVSNVTARLLAALSIKDLTVEDVPIEDVVEGLLSR